MDLPTNWDAALSFFKRAVPLVLPPAAAGAWMFRPRLQLTLRTPSHRQHVFKRYGERICQAIYIRVWVYNFGLLGAKDCSVRVERVTFESGEVVEAEPSPLQWKDKDGCYEPLPLHRGFGAGRYVDVCSTDEFVPHLQVMSLKASKGAEPFRRGGLYTLHISARASGLASAGTIRLQVRHHGGEWGKLEIVSAMERRKWLRFW